MSRPLAATAVATMIGVWPHLNRLEVFTLVENFHRRDFKPQSFLALALSSISMDGGDGESLSVEELIQGISSTLGLHKDQGS